MVLDFIRVLFLTRLHAVAESFPEQITFTLTPGKTFDLRSHVKLYVVRNNVKWSAK